MHLPDLVNYLAELADNNNRAWFVMNKPRYDILREEFFQLVAELIAQIGRFDSLVVNCDPKKAIFRINRDVRFAKDKRPYKTKFSAAIVPGNLRMPSQGGGPAYYFHIDEKGELLFSVCEYTPPPERLKQIRAHIAQDGASFVKVLKNKKLRTTFGDLRQDGNDKLQRPPKGFDADHPQIELIKLKHYVLYTQVPISLFKADQQALTNTLVNGFKDAYPFVGWLRNISS